jgi:hypothetical protein
MALGGREGWTADRFGSQHFPQTPSSIDRDASIIVILAVAAGRLPFRGPRSSIHVGCAGEAAGPAHDTIARMRIAPLGELGLGGRNAAG